MKKFSILFSSFAFLAIMLNAQPFLPFYEPFSATQLGTLAPQNGWTGSSGVGQGAQVVDTTLTYSVLSTTAMSKAVRVGNQASGGLQTLPFASQTSEVFVSFLINLPVLPIAPANASAYYFALGNGNTGTACMYAFPNTDGTTFELGFSPTPNQTTAENNKTNRQFALNTTIMVVMANTPAPTSAGSGSLDVWVNPSAASISPGGTPGAFSFENRTGGTQTSINTILLRSGSTVRPMILDEIRVGNSWTDIISNNAVLPVSLKDFKLTTNNNISSLSWASETEINFNKYVVQFSNNGVDYKEVGTVEGKGNNSTYLFNYIHRSSGFIKLKLVDLDGRFVYSNVLHAKIKSLTIQVGPNPFVDKVYITGMPEGKNTAAIYTLSGASVASQTVENTNLTLSLGSLPIGQYVVKVINNAKTVYSTIVAK
jgi:Secretion system C-terminal sorting domain